MVHGKELIFISQIKRDGSGTTAIDKEYRKFLQPEKFSLRCLSLTYGTWIASGFNSFVVKPKAKLKNDKKRLYADY